MRVSMMSAAQVYQTIRKTSSRLTVVLPEAYVAERGPDTRAIAEVVQRGVSSQVYIVRCPSSRGAQIPEGVGAFAGARVNVIDGHYPRLAVLDNRFLLMPAHNGNYLDGGILNASPALATLLDHLMMETLGEETVAPDPVREPEQGLSPTERAVLRQLARGAKDDAAARYLNMATRTYRRAVASLMKRLSADSRFEAGYRAAKAGL